MLLPSPMKHIFRPSNEPLYSRIVMRSAKIWHGWQKSVKPLMTGTEPYFARSSASFCSKVRIMMPST